MGRGKDVGAVARKAADLAREAALSASDGGVAGHLSGASGRLERAADVCERGAAVDTAVGELSAAVSLVDRALSASAGGEEWAVPAAEVRRRTLAIARQVTEGTWACEHLFGEYTEPFQATLPDEWELHEAALSGDGDAKAALSCVSWARTAFADGAREAHERQAGPGPALAAALSAEGAAREVVDALGQVSGGKGPAAGAASRLEAKWRALLDMAADDARALGRACRG